jgi:hypothetical protein
MPRLIARKQVSVSYKWISRVFPTNKSVFHYGLKMKNTTMKTLALSILTTSLIACGGESSKSATTVALNETASISTCADGVTIPDTLIGSWETPFARDGANGIRTFTFDANCTISQSETGNYQIMSVYAAGLDTEANFKFMSGEKASITLLNASLIGFAETNGTASITDTDTNEEVSTFAFATPAAVFPYGFSNEDTLVIPAPTGAITFTRKQD